MEPKRGGVVLDPIEVVGAEERPDGEDGDAQAADVGGTRRRSTIARLRRILALSAAPAGIFTATRAAMVLVAAAVAADERTGILHALVRWDSNWYLTVAEHGYPSVLPTAGTSSPLGFFPLLPLAIRLVERVTGVSYVAAGIGVTFAGGLIGAVVVWWLLCDSDGRLAANRGTALVFLSPGAFVLSMIYSESLLIPLVAGALLALRRRRWLVAGVLAGLATATDPLAGAVVLACAATAAVAIWKRRDWWSLVAVVLSPWGIAAFFAYLWVHTGTPLAWYIAQRRGWQGGAFGTAVVNDVTAVLHGSHDPNLTIRLASLVACVLLLAALAWIRPHVSIVAYVIGLLALAVASPIVGITPRVLLRGFPLLAVVGARLRGGWFEGVLGFSAVSMAALAVLSMGSLAFTP